MNIVAISGNLTADPTLNNASEDTVYCRFTVAVKRPRVKDKTDFIKCVAWNKTAEFIVDYFKKGKRIEVSGCIVTGEYTDKNGDTRYSTEINVNDVGFGGGNKSDDEANPDNGKKPAGKKKPELQPYNYDDDDIPF